MVRLGTNARLEDDDDEAGAVAPESVGGPRNQPRRHSVIRRQRARDPFWDDGVGARQIQRRVRIESGIALAIAVTACGLTAALWLRTLAPLAGAIGLS
ncbi:MAG: hypothetical protein QOG32_1351 [Chloroflexota bacterium]|jgi:hypothetical protein|nr:hypothetical protein [Chloroflexota bacterium]